MFRLAHIPALLTALSVAAAATADEPSKPEPPAAQERSAAGHHEGPTPVVPWQRYPVYAVDPLTGTLVPTGTFVVFSPVGAPPGEPTEALAERGGAGSAAPPTKSLPSGPPPQLGNAPVAGLTTTRPLPEDLVPSEIDPDAEQDLDDGEPKANEGDAPSAEAAPTGAFEPEDAPETAPVDGEDPEAAAAQASSGGDASPATARPGEATTTAEAGAEGSTTPPAGPLTRPTSVAGGALPSASIPAPATPSPRPALPIAGAVGGGIAAGAITGAVVASQRGGGGTRAAAAAATAGRSCTTDADCDDGRFCNGDELCRDGVCEAGTPPDLSDDIACTLDVCDEASRSIQHLPMHSLCSDDVFCNGTELCDPSGGCVVGAPLPEGPDGLGCFDYTCVEDEQTLYRSVLPSADPLVCPVPETDAAPAGATRRAPAPAPATEDKP